VKVVAVAPMTIAGLALTMSCRYRSRTYRLGSVGTLVVSY